MDPFLMELQAMWLGAAGGRASSLSSSPSARDNTPSTITSSMADAVGAEPLHLVSAAVPRLGSLVRDSVYVATLVRSRQTALFADSGVLLTIVFVDIESSSSLTRDSGNAEGNRGAVLPHAVSGSMQTLVQSLCAATRSVFCGASESVELKESSLSSAAKVAELGRMAFDLLTCTGHSSGSPFPELL
jgi:hypothetical protein